MILNSLFTACGLICVGLGTVGIFLPILPTTPFYILAVLCFAKGSERFHSWFTSTNLYSKYIESYAKNRSMTLKSKFAVLIPVTVMLILTAAITDMLVIKIVIAVLLAVKYWYFIYKIKTKYP
ncbi:MAG: YbaN family protein [Synergistaceae bacterium]|nr:YbaN family protein [Synergistaceae bacterium]